MQWSWFIIYFSNESDSDSDDDSDCDHDDSANEQICVLMYNRVTGLLGSWVSVWLMRGPEVD
jgi:hypothetical protein